MKTIDASIKLEKHKGQQLEILIYFFDLEPYENSYPVVYHVKDDSINFWAKAVQLHDGKAVGT